MTTQFVKYNESDSELLLMKQGVPQGSILGPLLFLLFINDIVESSRKLQYVLYADDTNIFYSGKHLKDLIFEANVELQKVASCFSANKLKINQTKTKFMIFNFGKKKMILKLKMLI